MSSVKPKHEIVSESQIFSDDPSKKGQSQTLVSFYDDAGLIQSEIFDHLAWSTLNHDSLIEERLRGKK